MYKAWAITKRREGFFLLKYPYSIKYDCRVGAAGKFCGVFVSHSFFFSFFSFFSWSVCLTIVLSCTLHSIYLRITVNQYEYPSYFPEVNWVTMSLRC